MNKTWLIGVLPAANKVYVFPSLIRDPMLAISVLSRKVGSPHHSGLSCNPDSFLEWCIMSTPRQRASTSTHGGRYCMAHRGSKLVTMIRKLVTIYNSHPVRSPNQQQISRPHLNPPPRNGHTQSSARNPVSILGDGTGRRNPRRPPRSARSLQSTSQADIPRKGPSRSYPGQRTNPQ